MESEELTKVRVDLPNHRASGGESMWALPLGNDTYELRNTPFHAYDLNFLDVVEARSATPDQKPAVVRVVTRSGHRTLRVQFSEAMPVQDRLNRLESLASLGASFEGKDDGFFAIDVSPDGGYEAVCDQLAVWGREGALDYETCEARVVGSFDDRPSGPRANSG